ncbi:hypothetical protein MKEN_00491600 [Mycena kentingensis (nom. inval.)]|nr:hypothetical protein MKEN_00491600 [Mycena kentingensis (nom. inval.)]
MSTAVAPPPTTHALPKTQRLRLMRSTRKLAALLGAAPLLLDPREPLPPVPRYSPMDGNAGVPATPTIDAVLAGSADSPSPPTLESIAIATSPVMSARPTLLLRINTLPTQANRPRAASQSWGRPASVYASLPSPRSAESPLDDDDEEEDAIVHAQAERRRKMARVARRLGDGVPIDLVFPSESRSPSPGSRFEVSEKHKMSLDGTEARRVTVPPSAFRGRCETPPPSTKSSPPSTRPSTSTETRSLRRSASLLFREKEVQQRPATTRTETGWTGEWNQDEEAVVKKLRALK